MPNDRKLFGQACDHALEIMVRHGFVVHFKRARSPSAVERSLLRRATTQLQAENHAVQERRN
jgi:hypothetical protein